MNNKMKKTIIAVFLLSLIIVCGCKETETDKSRRRLDRLIMESKCVTEIEGIYRGTLTKYKYDWDDNEVQCYGFGIYPDGEDFSFGVKIIFDDDGYIQEVRK